VRGDVGKEVFAELGCPPKDELFLFGKGFGVFREHFVDVIVGKCAECAIFSLIMRKITRLFNSPYAVNGPMEAEANSDLREEAKRS
jgi:hypothetical protein